MCEAGRTSPAGQAGISASRSAHPAFGEGSRERIHATWRADARSRCRLEEMEPCVARTRSDGYFTDGCVAARIADDRLDRPRVQQGQRALVQGSARRAVDRRCDGLELGGMAFR
jgi:hypothetical protein